MKTAEEWIEQYRIGFVLRPSDIEQIQLDAMKEGARRAAKIAHNQALDRAGINRSSTQVTSDEKAILTTAEQWTEADL